MHGQTFNTCRNKSVVSGRAGADGVHRPGDTIQMLPLLLDKGALLKRLTILFNFVCPNQNDLPY